MTSDAKIGLLLGLVFIFIIAFIINGLPGLSQDSHNNTLTAEIFLNKFIFQAVITYDGNLSVFI